MDERTKIASFFELETFMNEKEAESIYDCVISILFLETASRILWKYEKSIAEQDPSSNNKDICKFLVIKVRRIAFKMALMSGVNNAP